MSHPDSGATAERWRLPPSSALSWRRLDDGVVVRDREGSTHWLSEASSAVVLLLGGHGAHSLEALADQLLPPQPSVADLATLQSLMTELAARGLVERA